jgi:hypothetical protein
MVILPFGLSIAFTERGEKCPRQILGYDCHGYSCNHSSDAIEEARATKHNHGI